MEGSVSGGRVEAAVELEAIDTFENGAEKLITCGVTNRDAFAGGLDLSIKIMMLLEPVKAVLGLNIFGELSRVRAVRHSISFILLSKTVLEIFFVPGRR